MNSDVRRKLDMGARVRAFVSAHAAAEPGYAPFITRLDELLTRADAVTLHVPLTAETHGLIDERRLSLLRDGAVLVNTARAELIDRQPLVRELVSGRLRAGLDVFWDEPSVPEELVGLENVVLTPHIGSATVTARHAMTELVVENVLAVLAGRSPLTPV